MSLSSVILEDIKLQRLYHTVYCMHVVSVVKAYLNVQSHQKRWMGFETAIT
jgi:hypothetical protein